MALHLVTFRRWVSSICFLLALCIALGGQLRVADAPGPDDADDDITLSADDSVFTLRQTLTLEPPKTSSRAVPPLLASGRGRRVIAELFRPPITVAPRVFVA
jgi:hypothetical protein